MNKTSQLIYLIQLCDAFRSILVLALGVAVVATVVGLIVILSNSEEEEDVQKQIDRNTLELKYLDDENEDQDKLERSREDIQQENRELKRKQAKFLRAKNPACNRLVCVTGVITFITIIGLVFIPTEKTMTGIAISQGIDSAIHTPETREILQTLKRYLEK